MLPNVTQSFKLQRPDLESCRAEVMLTLFIAEHCSTRIYCIKTCNHLKEIVKNCVSYKKNEASWSYVAQNFDWKKIVGRKMLVKTGIFNSCLL